MANVVGGRVNGNLVYYDYSKSRRRLVDAVGPDVIKYVEDFVNARLAGADAPNGWTVTLVEAGAGETTITPSDELGGALVITTDANEDDGANLQVAGENFKLSTAAKLVYFYARVKISDATQSDLLIGLCIADTTLLGGMTDGVYFEKLDGGTGISAVTEKNSTETQTDGLHTAVADTYVELEFYFEQGFVEFYINNVMVAKHTTNICDDEELTPSIQFLAGAAAVKTCNIEKLVAIQIGR